MIIPCDSYFMKYYEIEFLRLANSMHLQLVWMLGRRSHDFHHHTIHTLDASMLQMPSTYILITYVLVWNHFSIVYVHRYYRSRRTKFEPALANECDCMIAETNKMIPIARKAMHSSIVRACASASSFIANAYGGDIFSGIKTIHSTSVSAFEYLLRRLQQTK